MDRKNLEIPIGVIAKVVLSLQTNEMICTLSHKRTVVINRGDFRQFEWQLTPRRETNTPKTTIQNNSIRVLWHFEAFGFYGFSGMTMPKSQVQRSTSQALQAVEKKHTALNGEYQASSQVKQIGISVPMTEKIPQKVRDKLLINKHSLHHNNLRL